MENNPEKFSYAILEWLWTSGDIRLSLPGTAKEAFYKGSYKELTNLLSQLGQNGWEVVACAGTANWLLWTLKHRE